VITAPHAMGSSASRPRSPRALALLALVTSVALCAALLPTTGADARPEPTLRVIAGGGTSPDDGIPATDARLGSAEGVDARPDGSFVLADTYANLIRAVGTDGTITTLAGTGAFGSAGDGGAASDASFAFPFDVAVAPDGAVYVADTYGHRIRRIDRDGTITTVAGTGMPGSTGTGGPATAARLRFPFGVDVAADGTLLIADTFNHRVVRVDRTGRLLVVAGTGIAGDGADGASAAETALRVPYTARFAPAGRVVIADTGNDRIREVGRDGRSTTIAGDGTRGFSGDGGPATEAQLSAPHSVAVDARGRVVVADTNNRRLREIRADGTIVTIAGGTGARATDGTAASEASLHFRSGLVSPRPGVLVLAEAYEQRIVELR
jgi:hypothetical protein